MDFRQAATELDYGVLSEAELTEQLINLPCLYALFRGEQELYCLDVVNGQDGSPLSLALLYSSLELAMSAAMAYSLTGGNWQVAQWSRVDAALRCCLELSIDGVAFDSLPHGSSLGGLVIDRHSLEQLATLATC